jgi:hypothetical protein
MKEESLTVILDTLAERIKSLEDDIYIKDLCIRNLEKELAEARRGCRSEKD